MAEHALAGGDEGIGVDETGDLRIVISGLQVIERGILDSIFATLSFFALLPLAFESENQGW